MKCPSPPPSPQIVLYFAIFLAIFLLLLLVAAIVILICTVLGCRHYKQRRGGANLTLAWTGAVGESIVESGKGATLLAIKEKELLEDDVLYYGEPKEFPRERLLVEREIGKQVFNCAIRRDCNVNFPPKKYLVRMM